MAFNFNWAPLSGDPDFYKRAEELLTNAMNKNQKPPIIVDDIVVNELNLGDVPPDLEVVEISDIGVDKFRGTFKMSYAGNAFITIKTRVQANPLNTYLVTRPTYTSPRPLAAAAGLTIPLQITLSDFKLSAIIILVFSRQKGLTIVFRNDPLDALKVSSTFDSIPFVANYLQQVIEGQLRTLFMDELPAIIHRMSLRLWVPEHKAQEEKALREDDNAINPDEMAIDPLATPPQDPVDASGVALSPQDVATLSLDSHLGTQHLFSRKNMLRLATLTDSHRTLSLFTPKIQDAVFRAWTGPLERGEMTGSHSKVTTPALSRSHSYSGSIKSSYSFDNISQARPALHTYNSVTSNISLGGSRLKPHNNRKRKKRVVNLRKSAATGEMETVIEDGSTVTDSTSVTGSTSDIPTVFSAPPATLSSGPSGLNDPVTPPQSPGTARRHGKEVDQTSNIPDETTPLARMKPQKPTHIDLGESVHDDLYIPDAFGSGRPYSPHSDRSARPRQRRVVNLNRSQTADDTPTQSMYLPAQSHQLQHGTRHSGGHMNSNPSSTQSHGFPRHSEEEPGRTSSSTIEKPASANSDLVESTQEQPPALPNFLSFITNTSNSTSIAERAWMMKMAAEVSRRYNEERNRGSFELPQSPSALAGEEGPPPAYAR